jgi:SAM-dependent methyltransferase
MLEWHRGRSAIDMIERDDGLIVANQSAPVLFAPLRRWPEAEREAVLLTRGDVLDVGCGPGRVALHLQGQGHRVTAIDHSPLVVQVARERGVADCRVLGIDEVGPDAGPFETVIMFGNGFGLLRSRAAAPRLLRRLAAVTTPGAQILASTLDIYQTDDPIHLAYHARNRARGRMSGQLRLRIRHRHHATPWYDFLMVSREEMAEVARAGGWRLDRTIGEGRFYVGVLTRSEPG